MEAIPESPIMNTNQHISADEASVSYAATVLGTKVELLQLPPALAQSCLRNLSRSDELADRKDAWGNWEGPEGKPDIGFRKAFLDRSILNWGVSQGIAQRSIWPGGAEWAFCLTHDMDFVSRYARWREVSILLGRLVRGGADFRAAARRIGGGLLRSAGGLREDPWWCFEQWISMAEDAGARSTWLIFPERVSKPHAWDAAYSYNDTVRFGRRKMKVREMLKEIGGAGMEVGLHPSVHAACDAALLRDQRNQVADAAGCEVTSVRQHFLRWNAGKTPEAQSEAGLSVDSTLGFNRGIGFRTGGCYPYKMPDPVTGQCGPLIQIPLQLMDVALFSEDGLGCRTVDEAIGACMTVMEEVQAVGGVLVLNWHPNSISTEPMMAVIRTLLSEVKRRHPWGATLAGVAAHWKGRSWMDSGQNT